MSKYFKSDTVILVSYIKEPTIESIVVPCFKSNALYYVSKFYTGMGLTIPIIVSSNCCWSTYISYEVCSIQRSL